MHTTHSNITPSAIRRVSPLVSMETSRPFHRIKQKILGYKSKSMLFISNKIKICSKQDKDSSSLLLASVHSPRVTIKLSSYYLRWHLCQTIKTNPCKNLCSDAFCLCLCSFHWVISHRQIWFEARRLRKEMELHQSPLINLFIASLNLLLNCLGCFGNEKCFGCR